jgi:hypothetical protein
MESMNEDQLFLYFRKCLHLVQLNDQQWFGLMSNINVLFQEIRNVYSKKSVRILTCQTRTIQYEDCFKNISYPS